MTAEGDEHDLERRKALVSRKYLGKQGIHGVGISRAQSAVKVYIDREQAAENIEQVLEAMRTEVAPFALLVLPADRATTSDED